MQESTIDNSVLERKMQPIEEIIIDETYYYFTGQKSMEDVIDVLNNRVQLYLDENPGFFSFYQK